MKKIVWILAIIAVIAFLPVTANAYSQHRGIFIASDYSEAYHILFCRDVRKIGNHRTYYESTDDAEADGKRPCYHCSDFILIIRGDYIGTAQEREIIDVFLEGYYAGQNVGYDSAYEDWYEKRFSDGYDKGYGDGAKDANAAANAALSEKLAENTKVAVIGTVSVIVFVILPIGSAIIDSLPTPGNILRKSKIKHLEAENRKLRNSTVIQQLIPDLDIDIPDGIELTTICVPVKGIVLNYRPYGDYTVYTSAKGSKYHCRYRCGNATNPIHYFSVPGALEPCKNCVPADMHPKPLPDWYIKIQQQHNSN